MTDSVSAQTKELMENQKGAVLEVRDGVLNEKVSEVDRTLRESQQLATSDEDVYLVSWDSEEDPHNPKNWPKSHKWTETIIVSLFTFIAPVSSSMVAPALDAIAADLSITDQTERALVLSIFVLGYAMGPLVLGPLSEVYGRVPVLQLSNLFYLVWNTACGFSKSKSQILAFRLLSGMGGSAPLAVGGGVLSDCWRAEERGLSISIYDLAPLLGPAIGPIAGGFITENTTWRWAFYATSIAGLVIQLLGLLFLHETYAPKLLQRKAAKKRKETGNPAYYTVFDTADKAIVQVLKTSLSRPFILLATQPIVQVLATYMAYLYGLMFLVLSTFPQLWSRTYHQSVGLGGLHYISIGLGSFLGTQVCAPINDYIYKRLKTQNAGVGKPEFRAPLMIPGAILVPIGFFWYGWSAQAQAHWILPDIGACIMSAGIIIGFFCIHTYIIDSYTRYAASAVGATTVLRSLAGFAFPMFAPQMYARLGMGWGNSLLGFIAIVLGFPAPFLFWRYGATLRAKSQFAAG